MSDPYEDDPLLKAAVQYAGARERHKDYVFENPVSDAVEQALFEAKRRARHALFLAARKSAAEEIVALMSSEEWR